MPARSGRSTGEIVRANVLTRINAILGILLVIVLTTCLLYTSRCV